MLSKILTASALGGQFWIKDQRRAKPLLCVLELDALYVLSEASGLAHRPRDSVLRELFKTIEVRRPCQPDIYRSTSWDISKVVPPISSDYPKIGVSRAGIFPATAQILKTT
jgi:hypothetical protein